MTKEIADMTDAELQAEMVAGREQQQMAEYQDDPRAYREMDSSGAARIRSAAAEIERREIAAIRI